LTKQQETGAVLVGADTAAASGDGGLGKGEGEGKRGDDGYHKAYGKG